MEKVVVAYSGGVDSAFLLKVAADTLGTDHVMAILAISPTYPSREYNTGTGNGILHRGKGGDHSYEGG